MKYSTRIEKQDFDAISTKIDWVIKLRLLNRYMDKHDLTLFDYRIAQLDLAYHDITRGRGLFHILESAGQAERITSEVEVFEAKSVAAADDSGQAPWRVHQAAQANAPRLHRRLGASQTQRPSPADRAVQGPVQGSRRAGGSVAGIPVGPLSG